jgi:exopolysaccharide biosynthesis polyprenyl glycosylphosphotransferase
MIWPKKANQSNNGLVRIGVAVQIEQKNLNTESVLSEQHEPYTRLPRTVVKGIAGLFCGIGDLALLSTTLIYLALSANGIYSGDSLINLLAIRLSVEHFVVLILCWIIWRAILSYCGLYTWQQVRSLEGVVGRLMLSSGLCALVAGGVMALPWHHGHFGRHMTFFYLITNSSLLLLRVLIGGYQLQVRPHFRGTRNVVIVGSGAHAERVYHDLMSHPEWRYKLLGFVDNRSLSTPELASRILGRISDLEEILMRQVVDEVVITLPMKSHYNAIERVIEVCERSGVQLQYCADLFETSITKQIYSEERDYRSVILKMVYDDYRKHVKRGIDIVGATSGMLLLSPLFLSVAALIKITSRGPVFFKQERYGLNKRTFYIYKFRSMVEDAEAAQATLEHMNENSGPVFKIFADPRVTELGAFLRKTSIDELPQLFNVLLGEMSLVGPRPLNTRDVGRFSEAWLMRRFSVKPGLTCLWQVSGRSNISFDRWIALDLHYIDHWSLLLDMKILAMTFPAVIKGRGAA